MAEYFLKYHQYCGPRRSSKLSIGKYLGILKKRLLKDCNDTVCEIKKQAFWKKWTHVDSTLLKPWPEDKTRATKEVQVFIIEMFWNRPHKR